MQATGAQWIDPVAALLVALAIVVTGLRLLIRAGEVLVDQALPADEIAVIAQVIEGFSDRGVIGYHELRTRRGGSQRYVDLHIQFRKGTSLEDAHHTAHQLQDRIAETLGGADVLIHLEPEDRVRPGHRLHPASARVAERGRRQAGRSCSGEVDRRRDRDREGDSGVTAIPVDEHDDGCHEAYDRRHQPGEAAQLHVLRMPVSPAGVSRSERKSRWSKGFRGHQDPLTVRKPC